LCVEEGIVQPTGGQYLMRPRALHEIHEKDTASE
jgi:hypothetical protein